MGIVIMDLCQSGVRARHWRSLSSCLVVLWQSFRLFPGYIIPVRFTESQTGLCFLTWNRKYNKNKLYLLWFHLPAPSGFQLNRAERKHNNFNDFVWRPVSLLYSCVWGCLTGREEVVDGSGGVERRQLQALSQAVQSMALDSGRFIHPSSKEQVLDKGAVHQETTKVRISTLLRSSLWLLQQNHHHIHREQPVHHL